MYTPSLHAIPELSEGVRVCWDHEEHAHILLYPDGMVVLNPNVSRLLQLCNGQLSINQIITQFDSSRPDDLGGQQLLVELNHAVKSINSLSLPLSPSLVVDRNPKLPV
jgi:pyrroloquinoline quinone biosynthesis protein D